MFFCCCFKRQPQHHLYTTSKDWQLTLQTRLRVKAQTTAGPVTNSKVHAYLTFPVSVKQRDGGRNERNAGHYSGGLCPTAFETSSSLQRARGTVREGSPDTHSLLNDGTASVQTLRNQTVLANCKVSRFGLVVRARSAGRISSDGPRFDSPRDRCLCDFAGTLVPVPKSTECYWDVNLILFNFRLSAFRLTVVFTNCGLWPLSPRTILQVFKHSGIRPYWQTAK